MIISYNNQSRIYGAMNTGVKECTASSVEDFIQNMENSLGHVA